MGDPRKLRKKYRTPRHPWQKDRLDSELRILGRYGLRNKREIWKMKTKIDKFRSTAKSLLALSEREAAIKQREMIEKLNRLGLLPANATLDDVLSLNLEDLLERRLQTIVVHKGLANNMDQARQFIVHGHIAIAGTRITSPSHIVLRTEEDEIRYAPSSPFANPDHPIHKSKAAGES
ncbi:MAG: 30S ribosomal protein S4 [Candidatus Helarchaeota archaeon]